VLFEKSNESGLLKMVVAGDRLSQSFALHDGK
jgi:hypothetical protein